MGIRYPHARVINHTSQAVSAAQSMDYPVMVNPNIGGSGAKLQLFHERGGVGDGSSVGHARFGDR